MKIPKRNDVGDVPDMLEKQATRATFLFLIIIFLFIIFFLTYLVISKQIQNIRTNMPLFGKLLSLNKLRKYSMDICALKLVASVFSLKKSFHPQLALDISKS